MPLLPLAACRAAPPEMFFPDREYLPAGRYAEQVDKAVAVCRRCPESVACREWALDHPSLTEIGVWGGLTPKDRSRVAARVRKAKSVREAAANR